MLLGYLQAKLTAPNLILVISLLAMEIAFIIITIFMTRNGLILYTGTKMTIIKILNCRIN
ncbi:MAG: hypothetical protein BGO52_02360 [Sphingobacteriales bacterium 44-61]|nr:MAG: hypothetical protein BGO52_02360 [Sphingobacteriales bacterium 44-61]